MLAANSAKFGTFAGRNKASAKGAMDRSAAAAEDSPLIVIFWYWKRETRVQRMKRYAQDKNNKKKQQLIGVKGLFKNFANELEAGLKDGTPRVEAGTVSKKRSGRPSPKLSEADGYGPA